jgi:hypothetical protein
MSIGNDHEMTIVVRVLVEDDIIMLAAKQDEPGPVVPDCDCGAKDTRLLLPPPGGNIAEAPRAHEPFHAVPG